MIRKEMVRHVAIRPSLHHDHDRLPVVDDATYDNANEDGAGLVRGHCNQVNRVD